MPILDHEGRMTSPEVFCLNRLLLSEKTLLFFFYKQTFKILGYLRKSEGLSQFLRLDYKSY